MRFMLCYIGLFFTPFLLHAQVDFGIEVGMNAGAPIPSKMVKGAQGNPGISGVVGLSAKYTWNRRLEVQALILYDRKKAKYISPVSYPYIVMSGDSIDSFSGIVDGRFNNQYVTLPVSVRYVFNSRLSAGGGFYFSYLLQGSNKGLVTNGKAGFNGMFKIDDQVFDESKNINPFELGMNVNVKYQIQKHLSLQWLTTYGINSVTKPTDNFKDKVHNIYTYLTIGYSF
jgi:hypothetical protein